MNRRLFSLSLLASTFATFCAVLAGCNGGSLNSSTTPSNPSNPGSQASSPFSIASTMPANAATNVALNSTIQIVFSSAANASTVNTTDIVVSDSSGSVGGAVSYNASNNAATFSPSAPLVAGTTYTVRVSGVTSSGGTAMTSAGTFTFTTLGAAPASLQYEAPLGGFGQVTVDAAGNFTIQLEGASTTNETLTALFCPIRVSYNQAVACFSVGTISTDGNGNGSTTAMFPQAGSWAGDFELFPGTNPNVNTTVPTYMTGYGTNYMSTLQPDNTVDSGVFASIDSGYQQAPLSSGTVTYSTSPAPYGTLTFTLAGAPANTTFESAGSYNGLENTELESSSGVTQFESNSQGGLTFAVSTAGGGGGDIFQVSPVQNSMNETQYLGYIGGFLVP